MRNLMHVLLFVLIITVLHYEALADNCPDGYIGNAREVAWCEQAAERIYSKKIDMLLDELKNKYDKNSDNLSKEENDNNKTIWKQLSASQTAWKDFVDKNCKAMDLLQGSFVSCTSDYYRERYRELYDASNCYLSRYSITSNEMIECAKQADTDFDKIYSKVETGIGTGDNYDQLNKVIETIK